MDATIIRICILLFGLIFCSVKCVHFGLISPIEVVEEFGCHDTELRLTCGDLDSKLAILEATFTPNCTHDECLHFDLKRLVRAFTSEESGESKNAEKEAGQKFLETLRQNDSNGEDQDVEILDDIDLPDELNGTADKRSRKHTSLRMVLERLIIRYLRRISSEDEIADERSLRSRRTVEQPTENPNEYETAEDSEITEEEESIRAKSARPHCDEQRKQISSLNRLDVEKSYRNQSDNEYNIRKVLNKRCSGRNHCSFIFSIDHPFAKVWKGGIVRVKYICMEDFRINRYCAEHLTIDYEVDPKVQVVELAKGDPKAEPRIQPRETSLHSLKIIKTSKNSAPNSVRNTTSSSPEIRKTKIDSPVTHHTNSAEAHKNRIYSQDFRVLKIIPSNIDDFNDLETIGDEIYFKKEVDLSTQQGNTYEQTPSTATYDTKTALDNMTEKINENIILSGKGENANNSSSNLENVTLTIREGGHYIMVYPSSNETSGNALVPSNTMVIKNNNTMENDTTTQSTSSTSYKSNRNNTFEYPISSTENPSPPSSISTEDVDETGRDQLKEDTIQRTYNSIQRTSYRSPLLHGFAMTPGYPKFYIGEFDCHWNILAPDGVKIWLTVLDNSLRFDEVCKDYLLIEDVGTNQTLFNSCSDVIQPIGIKSSSNWVKVSIKTTSKFAYPKRGVLLYYTADGCVNQPLPSNVELVGSTKDSAFYECHPSYLFPDSGLSTRMLTCSPTYIWDKLLPDCIEQESLSRSAVPSEEKLTLISQKPDLSVVTNKMPTQSDADMVFDIIIPSLLITGLFIINGAVFAVIMKYRKRFVESVSALY